MSLLSALTAVLWIMATAAEIAGLRLQYTRPTLPPPPATPITVERLNVNVIRSKPTAQVPKVAPARQPPPEPLPAQSLPSPALAPVADLKLTVPFPVEVKTPSRLVPADKAVPLQSQPARAVANAVPVQRLTLGEGEGDQPAPEYPREAKLAHQEGRVVVQMSINENGDVTDAAVTSSSPWPILNQAALRAVRDTWHFKKGPQRRNDVEFDFELHKS